MLAQKVRYSILHEIMGLGFSFPFFVDAQPICARIRVGLPR